MRRATWSERPSWASSTGSCSPRRPTRTKAFFAGISELLDLWARRRHAGFAAVQVVGERWSAETHQLHDVLERSSIPAAFHEPGSPEGQRLLRLAGAEARVPVAVFHDGRILVQPTVADIAMAVGANAAPAETRFDLVVVGAGPAGLAAAVYGASEGLDVLVIDQDTHGGQAGTSSLIRNYLGFPSGISGQDLAARAYRQAYFLGARFLFGRRAVGLRADGDDRVVALDDGTEIRGRAVILATGVEYRRLGVDRLERLVGRGVYYGAATSEAPAMRGEDVIVVGGANSAGQAAVHLCRFARSVTLVVRGPSIEETMSEYLVREIDASGKVVVLTNTEIVDARGEHRLAGVTLRDATTGLTTERPVTAVFILIGAIPRTDWLPPSIRRDDHGFVLTGGDASASPSRPDGLTGRDEPARGVRRRRRPGRLDEADRVGRRGRLDRRPLRPRPPRAPGGRRRSVRRLEHRDGIPQRITHGVRDAGCGEVPGPAP